MSGIASNYCRLGTLLKAGYRVAVPIDVDEAMALLDGQNVQLAPVDFRLQHAEPDGLVARLNGYGIPLIFCTAASLEEVREHFPEVSILQRPFNDDDLLAVATLVSPQGSYDGA